MALVTVIPTVFYNNMDETSSLSRYHDREDASSMVTAGATATMTPRRGMVAHLGNQGCCVHIHTGNLSIS